MPAPQGRYWMVTLPYATFTPYLPEGMAYIKGQLEAGTETGHLHWQLLCYFNNKKTKTFIRNMLGDDTGTNFQLTRNEQAVEEYVWKEDTRVEGTQFELGSRPVRMNNKCDWAVVAGQAVSGELEKILEENPGVYVRCYNSLKRIKLDHQKPKTRGNVTVEVYYGVSGSGKSHKAWEELGYDDTYFKQPTTKWWCGYEAQKGVIIDEFRGQVSISLLLLWLDVAGRPLTLETKGGGCCASFTRVILTSNVHPRDWYPELDEMSKNALLRRLVITEFNEVYQE